MIYLHARRTTLGTVLARLGVAPQVAQQILRHKDYRTTLRHDTEPRHGHQVRFSLKPGEANEKTRVVPRLDAITVNVLDAVTSEPVPGATIRSVGRLFSSMLTFAHEPPWDMTTDEETGYLPGDKEGEWAFDISAAGCWTAVVSEVTAPESTEEPTDEETIVEAVVELDLGAEDV